MSWKIGRCSLTFAERGGGAGLSFAVRVAGKKQPPWCRSTRMEDSDGLHVWDRHARHTQHPSRQPFCHRFIFTPMGAGRRLDQPAADLLPINRARENPKPVASDKLGVRSEQRVDGYVLQAHIPAAALTGYDPDEHPRLGFSYAIVDRELGLANIQRGAGVFRSRKIPACGALWS